MKQKLLKSAKLYLITLSCLFIANLTLGQNVIDDIKYLYSKIDTTNYYKELQKSFIESKREIYENTLMFCFETNSTNKENKQILIDSLANITKFYFSENEHNLYGNNFNNNNAKFVLNIIIDSNLNIKVDTSILSFNIVVLDNKSHLQYYINVENGKYFEHSSFYPTAKLNIAKKMQSGLEYIMKKNPDYLLHCNDIEGIFIYVKNDKIFAFDILNQTEFILNDYLKTLKYPFYDINITMKEINEYKNRNLTDCTFDNIMTSKEWEMINKYNFSMTRIDPNIICTKIFSMTFNHQKQILNCYMKSPFSKSIKLMYTTNIYKIKMYYGIKEAQLYIRKKYFKLSDLKEYSRFYIIQAK